MSLRFKLLLPLAIACLVALAYLEIAWKPRSLDSQKHQYLEDVEHHVDAVIEGLVPLLLTNQLDLIRENLDQLRKKNPEWTFILLESSEGKQLYPLLGSAPATASPGAQMHLLEKSIRFLGKETGRLTVHIDFAARLARLEEQHRQLALMIVVIIALLALIWTVTLELAVVHPLRQLSAAADELSQKRFDTPLPRCSDDEVGVLACDFAAMRDSLARYHADLMREIAEHKRAEEEKSALAAGLEQRVVERTAALERAYKELEAFSYSVSHDLRAPLRAINGFSRLVLEAEGEKVSAESKQMLQRVAANAAKLGQLIDDILEYSRSGRQQLVPADVDLGAVAAQVAEELAGEHPNARIDIGPLPVVTGDPIMLGQVLQNLLANALKFSAMRDPPQVEIGAQQVDGERVFFVRDNGIGFDMRYAGKLFGMFQRMHSEYEFSGTGVGLAIVKRLVERHGGRIWAEAEPDRGATFRFTLGQPAP